VLCLTDASFFIKTLEDRTVEDCTVEDSKLIDSALPSKNGAWIQQEHNISYAQEIYINNLVGVNCALFAI
jgi:hypothetical protein